MRKKIIAVVGGGDEAPANVIEQAKVLGRLIADRGWVLLNGGRNAGVMNASAEGAQKAGGLTVGLLPESDARNASAFLDVQIITGLGSARNNLITLSSDVVIACPGGAGTLSEIALALKNKRHVILLGFDLGKEFHDIGRGKLHLVEDAESASDRAFQILQSNNIV